MQIQADVDAAPQEPATSAIPGAAARYSRHRAFQVDRSRDRRAAAARPPKSFERVEPRAPLSDLALAGPPKPPKLKMPDDWNGTKLFQPVASAAGVIEAKGYSVAVSGIDVVRQDETCTDDGKSWACGIRARTAFRAFLRGRAVVCKVPPEGGRDLITAECRIGKQDVGQWLVENGWARAATGGPYVEAGEKARAAKKGIFGTSARSLPACRRCTPAPSPDGLRQPGLDTRQDTQPTALLTPPADQPAPAQ